jgi:rhodanese-related sulfurtransferase
MGDLQETIEADDARQMLGRDEATLIDVRSAEDFAMGHIPGAVSAPDGDVPEELVEGTLIVVCQDGDQSAEIAAKLREGGAEAASIEGGMDAWDSDKLPLQPSSDPFAEDGKAPKLPGAGV